MKQKSTNFQIMMLSVTLYNYKSLKNSYINFLLSTSFKNVGMFMQHSSRQNATHTIFEMFLKFSY